METFIKELAYVCFVKESIQKWNIWWDNPGSLNALVGVERLFLSDLLKNLELPHIKDIIGIRRSGKTVLLYQVIFNLIKQGVKPKNILYLNFDDPQLKELEEAIKNSLELNPEISHVFLDEIQNINEWEKTIRVYYDRKKFKQVFVSGSSASLISRDIGKTLTGRHITKIVTPFSFKEFLNYHNIENPEQISKREKVTHFLEIYLKKGGFPETIDKDEFVSKTILVDLYNDILFRDIVSRFEADTETVKKIGYYLMTNISSQFSYNTIAKALNLHYDTVKKYVPFFEEVFLLFKLNEFSWKIKTQTQKMKAYSVDTGLRNAVSFKFSDDSGKLAENTVLIELKRRKTDVYFWKEKREIDFITKENNELTAINVTYTNQIPKREIEGLLEFKQKFKKTKKLVIITKDTEKKEKGINFIPLWKWLITKQ